MTGKIEWWVNTDRFILDGGRGWRRATRAAVQALRGPHDECLAILRGRDGEEVARSSSIWAARGVTVRLWLSPLPSPWTASVYTVAETEYAGVLREVETRLAEIDAMTADGPRDGVMWREVREALRAG